MTTVFWDAKRTVLTDYLECGSTIIGTYYADLIGIAHAALKEKVEESCHGMLFQQVIAPAHTSSQALPAIRNSVCE